MNDPTIREAFKVSNLKKYHRDTCLLFDELGILQGKSIVDLAVITPAYFHGFEIKSSEDTLYRLPDQIDQYSQVFDFITIITEEKYLYKIKNLVPSFWGIVLTEKVRDDIYFNYVRHPASNPLSKDLKKAELLWRDEVYGLLKKYNYKGASKLKRKAMWKILVNILDSKTLRQEIFETLKQRKDWKKSF